MSEADALELFAKKLGGNDGDDATELATALEFMPLAIVQAAAYISQRAPRYSVRDYLQGFRRSERKRTSLLNHEGGHEGEQLRRDWEAKNSILITWQISFDYLQKIRPSAADLLSLMSFFDRQGIPETLLRNRSEHDISVDSDASHNNDDEDKASQSSGCDGFEDDILVLRNYSFISVNTDGISFEMHGLVQLATRDWLKAHGQQERWREQFIKNLDAELPTGDYENWARCQTLFPHAQSAAVQQPEGQDSSKDWASILYKAAWYAWTIGKGMEAENMSVQAMKVRKRILSQEHSDTMSSMAMTGLIYTFRGKYDAAEPLYRETLLLTEKVLGKEHPDTLTSMNNLAVLFDSQGRYDAAEPLYRETLLLTEKVLGKEHPDTLTSMNNLAVLFESQGKSSKPRTVVTGRRCCGLLRKGTRPS
jgi:tetratricopeptide (TPR) repeat protein